MTQKKLATEAEMAQPRISAMERPGTKQSLNLQTLVRVAAAFRVGLVVKFIPFSEMLKWENRFSQDYFDVLKLDVDRAFLDPQAPAPAVTKNSYGAGRVETAIQPLGRRAGSEWLAGFEAGIRAYEDKLMQIACLNTRDLAAQFTVTAPGLGNEGVLETPVPRKSPETAEYQGISVPASQPASGFEGRWALNA